MDTALHDYTKDPARAYWQFAEDWNFATEVWDYLQSRPDCSIWYLSTAQRLTESTYRVVFRTNEYLNPSAPDAILRLKVTQVGQWPMPEYQVSAF